MKINMRIGIAYSKRMQMENLSYCIRGLYSGEAAGGCLVFSLSGKMHCYCLRNQREHAELEIKGT